MNGFPPCLLIVSVEVDADVEEEWNRWYDDVHLPDALKCPGVIRGQRYVSTNQISESIRGEMSQSNARIYTTLYEIDSPAALTTPEFQAMRGWYHFAGRVRSRTQTLEHTRGARKPGLP